MYMLQCMKHMFDHIQTHVQGFVSQYIKNVSDYVTHIGFMYACFHVCWEHVFHACYNAWNIRWITYNHICICFNACNVCLIIYKHMCKALHHNLNTWKMCQIMYWYVTYLGIIYAAACNICMKHMLNAWNICVKHMFHVSCMKHMFAWWLVQL